MQVLQTSFRFIVAIACLLGLLATGPALSAPQLGARTLSSDKLENVNPDCLNCHGSNKEAITLLGKDGDKRKLLPVDPRKFSKGVHSDMLCTDCHKEITDNQANHKKSASAKKPDCAGCHEAIWENVKKEGLTKEKERLGQVVKSAEEYRQSFHAKPEKENPERVNATCVECHSAHDFNVPPKGTARRTVWHKTINETCGKCHEDQLEIYAASVHGEEFIDKGNIKAAVCIDCHSAHSVANTSSTNFKLGNTGSCASCHKTEAKSYSDTYHGKVNKLGYTYTARCVDCHDSHGIKRIDDPKSKVHPDNRMKTCQKCHDGKKMPKATAGFASFAPHANAHDFEKYPEMWVTTKFMIGLLIFVFAFFWLHSGLWYFREWQERKAQKLETHVRTEGLQLDESKHFQRFPIGWRIGHLAFALATMTLVLTGTTAMFANTDWAPVVAKALGGPQVLGIVHRVAAAVFISIFFIHFVYVMQRLLRDKDFRWFGPDSLVPNWKDLDDCIGMFKWFFGRGPRPQFDRWTYFEKFDYWAVFWGVSVIGGSGLMLALPHITATYLPGWVFNVATVVHGEEAFLAAVFLFTVHFFNNHFRPGKLPPPDVVMFTGTQSLEEFRQEHPAQYQRLLESGKLEALLVEAPSRPLHVGSVVLGLTLLAIGLTLLVLVFNGILGKIIGG